MSLRGCSFLGGWLSAVCWEFIPLSFEKQEKIYFDHYVVREYKLILVTKQELILKAVIPLMKSGAAQHDVKVQITLLQDLLHSSLYRPNI